MSGDYGCLPESPMKQEDDSSLEEEPEEEELEEDEVPDAVLQVEAESFS